MWMMLRQVRCVPVLLQYPRCCRGSMNELENTVRMNCRHHQKFYFCVECDDDFDIDHPLRLRIVSVELFHQRGSLVA